MIAAFTCYFHPPPLFAVFFSTTTSRGSQISSSAARLGWNPCTYVYVFLLFKNNKRKHRDSSAQFIAQNAFRKQIARAASRTARCKYSTQVPVSTDSSKDKKRGKNKRLVDWFIVFILGGGNGKKKHARTQISLPESALISKSVAAPFHSQSRRAVSFPIQLHRMDRLSVN